MHGPCELHTGGTVRTYRLLVMASALVALAGSSAEAQRRVTGKVTATTGEPVLTATVTVQGTTIGTYTNELGQYTLTVPNGQQALVVRRIGYKRTIAPAS